MERSDSQARDGKDEGDGTNVGVPRRWRRVLVPVILLALLFLSGVWRWWDVQTDQRTMAAIRDEIDNGHSGVAVRELNALLDRKPGSDEAAFLLGTCEMAQGRMEEADRAFARVPPDSHFAPQAILGRVQLQMERGRFAEAEKLILDALNDPRVDRSGMPLLLGPIYAQQSRLAETLWLIEASWEALNQAGEGASDQAINLIRAHRDLEMNPVPIDVIRSALDQAGRSAPDDDRVWLGKANLALRVGSYDEASKWIDACLERRPRDSRVWRARLDWAVATNNVAAARAAFEHLPAEDWTPAQIQKLAAWLAAQRGDVGSEQRALEALLETNPGDLDALDRLAELAVKDGQQERAAELIRQKAEIGRLQARYQTLHKRNQPARDSAEMAQLAKRLGLWFEARAFLTAAIAEDPDNNDLRKELVSLDRFSRKTQEPGRTLADVLSKELDAGAAPPTPAAGPAR
jgi:enediyne biosynthesis protein E4